MTKAKIGSMWIIKLRFAAIPWLPVVTALLLATAFTVQAMRASAAPKQGGTLVIAAPSDVPTFDQQRTTSITVAGLASLLYDTLLFVDYDLKTLVPGLAKSWEVSPDGKTYTFHLRDDVKFHSGRMFTSADVKYTFERILDPPKAAVLRGKRSTRIRSPHKFRLGRVEAFETPNKTTFVMKLKNRQSDLLVQITSPFMGIIDRELVEKYGESYGAEGAGGTGPFKFEKWEIHKSTTLKRFSDYRWGPSFFKNKGPVHLDGVVFRIIPEMQTLLFEMERGNVHTLRHLRRTDIEVLNRNKNINILEAKPSQIIQYIGFKVTRPGLGDINVRRAISSAINKKELVKEVQRGHATVARSIFLSDTPAYWPGQESVFPRYNPDKAKAILGAAGWKPGSDGVRVKDGRRLELTFFGMVENAARSMAPLLQAQLRAVGIDLKARIAILPVYIPGLRKQNYDMWALGTPYISIHEILNFWYWSKNIPSPNRTMWKDTRTDDLLLQGRAGETQGARTKAVQGLQKIASENHLLVPLWHQKVLVPTRVEVKGFKPHGIYGSAYHKLLDVSLEK